MLELATTPAPRVRRPGAVDSERVRTLVAEAERRVHQLQVSVRRCRETLQLIADSSPTRLGADVLRLDFRGEGAVALTVVPQDDAEAVPTLPPPSAPQESAPPAVVVVTDSSRLTVGMAGRTHRLTPTEWQLLMELVRAGGAVTSRSELARGAWGTAFREQEVEVYVCRLRRKLAQIGARHVIETVRGEGYRAIGIR